MKEFGMTPPAWGTSWPSLWQRPSSFHWKLSTPLLSVGEVLPRIGDLPLDRGRGNGRGAAEIDVGVLRSETPGTVCHGGGDRDLAGMQQPHAPARAGPAARGQDERAGLLENLEQALAPDAVGRILRARRDQEPHAGGDAASLEDARGDLQVLVHPGAARADERVIHARAGDRGE